MNLVALPILCLLPLFAGILVFIIRNGAARKWILVSVAAIHLFLTLAASDPVSFSGGWFVLDSLGRIFLTILSLLFFLASLYALTAISRPRENMIDDDTIFSSAPDAVLTGCMLFFLSTMTLTTVSHHLGILWVAIEGTTLASAPLIYYHRSTDSLHAAWKYLLICSIGIALALLGNFFLVFSTADGCHSELPLLIGTLISNAHAFQPLWLKVAFIFLLIGYGTKMGLAPMHTWLPDAHGESPSFVSALLSGALLNCAFLGILRAVQMLDAAGLISFCRELLVIFGLFSMGFAAVMLFTQRGYKRMLAYSSIEHIGILALGVGIGGIAVYGSLFHAVNHSTTKAMLFFAAGNILAVYKTKDMDRVSNLSGILPWTGFIWIAGLFAITGSPPFGTFMSEMLVLSGMINSGNIAASVLYIVFLSLAFIAMARAFLAMARPDPAANNSNLPERTSEKPLSLIPSLVLLVIVLVLGLHTPLWLSDMLNRAAGMIGGGF